MSSTDEAASRPSFRNSAPSMWGGLSHHISPEDENEVAENENDRDRDDEYIPQVKTTPNSNLIPICETLAFTAGAYWALSANANYPLWAQMGIGGVGSAVIYPLWDYIYEKAIIPIMNYVIASCSDFKKIEYQSDWKQKAITSLALLPEVTVSIYVWSKAVEWALHRGDSPYPYLFADPLAVSLVGVFLSQWGIPLLRKCFGIGAHQISTKQTIYNIAIFFLQLSSSAMSWFWINALTNGNVLAISLSVFLSFFIPPHLVNLLFHPVVDTASSLGSCIYSGASQAYEAVSSGASQAYEAISSGASQMYETASSWMASCCFWSDGGESRETQYLLAGMASDIEGLVLDV